LSNKLGDKNPKINILISNKLGDKNLNRVKKLTSIILVG